MVRHPTPLQEQHLQGDPGVVAGCDYDRHLPAVPAQDQHHDPGRHRCRRAEGRAVEVPVRGRRARHHDRARGHRCAGAQGGAIEDAAGPAPLHLRRRPGVQRRLGRRAVGPDGKPLAFVSTDRGHKSATLRVADAQTGAVRDVYTETVATQYQSAPALDSVNWRYLPQSNEFIWFSQNSDWGHLYLHDLTTGKRKRQITAGDWNVTRIAHLDTDTRTLWFEGVGREPGNPYYVRYYKVGLDGGDVQLLTPENANHVITPSDDGKYFVDVYSTIDTAPVALLRDADGRLVAEIARADLTRLKASGWVPPSVFTVKARDGSTDLYGQMFKPSDFDPAKQYPIVVNIYPGPQQGSIDSRSFRPTYDDNQALAELGFIVIAVDGMGTPLRSKSFQDVSYANMADNTLPDQVAALKQLGAKYPWIDLDRIGIWGHS